MMRDFRQTRLKLGANLVLQILGQQNLAFGRGQRLRLNRFHDMDHFDATPEFRSEIFGSLQSGRQVAGQIDRVENF